MFQSCGQILLWVKRSYNLLHLSMGQKPIFLLGLGVQKSGTTWMHNHLSRHPDTAFDRNFTKEFDLAGSGYQRKPRLFEARRWWSARRCGQILSNAQAQGFDALDYHWPLGRKRGPLLRKFAQSGALNQAFFQWSKPSAVNPRGLVVGDITPTYLCLSIPQLEHLLLELRADFEVRPFVMWRDPLARLESAMKHVKRNEEQRGKMELAEFCQNGTIQGWSKHGNYAQAVETLNECLPDVYELVFEELFGPEGQLYLDDFHRWAGIRSVQGNFDLLIHDSKSSEQGLTPEQRDAARAFLASHYRAMTSRLGHERLAAIWNL